MRKYTPEQRARRAELERNRWRTRRAEAIEMLGGKCVDCGTDKQLEFDHKNPAEKEFAISQGTPSKERFFAELKKCELRCKNCHKKKSDREETGALVHATFAAYNRKKCRCAECVNWYSEYRKRQRKVS